MSEPDLVRLGDEVNDGRVDLDQSDAPTPQNANTEESAGEGKPAL